MGKTYRSWDVDQSLLLPASVHELVPAGHLAHLVRDLVRDVLDLSAILNSYAEERGQPPYHPTMMTALLLYSYCQGIYSSRRMARACEERVDFMAVTALQTPDFRTISDFRKRHLGALGALFGQVLLLCAEAGLVKLGHVALDGTKIRANASKHKAMSYGRMKQREPEFAAEVAKWLEEAAAADAAEDGSEGVHRRGDELPDWVRDKERRRAKMREAMAALEAEAAAAAGLEPAGRAESGAGAGEARADLPGVVAEADVEREGVESPCGEAPEAAACGESSSDDGGSVPRAPLPDDKAQRNFTDPESRIMKTANGFEQAYNAQAAVDAESQVIVAASLTNEGNDKRQVEPMADRIEHFTGRRPRELSADSGYCSEANLAELDRRGIRGYIATGRQKHGSSSGTGKGAGARVREMSVRLKRGGYRSRYRLRKQTVEPVFGQIKEARGFRRFLLRGLEQVAEEWMLICTAHNLLKLARAS